MRIIRFCWNPHCIYVRLSTSQTMFNLLAPLWNDWYQSSSCQMLLSLVNLRQCSPVQVLYRNRSIFPCEGVSWVFLPAIHLLNSDVRRGMHDRLDGIVYIYFTIKSLILNRILTVIWSIVVKQSILQCNTYMVYEYTEIISEHWSANSVPIVVFDLFVV